VGAEAPVLVLNGINRDSASGSICCPTALSWAAIASAASRTSFNEAFTLQVLAISEVVEMMTRKPETSTDLAKRDEIRALVVELRRTAQSSQVTDDGELD
jgi:hypothetical protein